MCVHCPALYVCVIVLLNTAVFCNCVMKTQQRLAGLLRVAAAAAGRCCRAVVKLPMAPAHVPPLLLVLLLSVQCHAAASRSDLACSLNGVLVGGKCKCDAPWRGSVCAKLDILPKKKGGLPAYGFAPNVTSWGGNAIQNDAGGYDLWVSEMVGGCGLNTWVKNSRVRICDNVFFCGCILNMIGLPRHARDAYRKISIKQDRFLRLCTPPRRAWTMRLCSRTRRCRSGRTTPHPCAPRKRTRPAPAATTSSTSAPASTPLRQRSAAAGTGRTLMLLAVLPPLPCPLLSPRRLARAWVSATNPPRWCIVATARRDLGSLCPPSAVREENTLVMFASASSQACLGKVIGFRGTISNRDALKRDCAACVTSLFHAGIGCNNPAPAFAKNGAAKPNSSSASSSSLFQSQEDKTFLSPCIVFLPSQACQNGCLPFRRLLFKFQNHVVFDVSISVFERKRAGTLFVLCSSSSIWRTVRNSHSFLFPIRISDDLPRQARGQTKRNAQRKTRTKTGSFFFFVFVFFFVFSHAHICMRR
jgi:hypothetical protein